MVRRVLERKRSATKVAADFGVSERTVRHWLASWRRAGLNDRRLAPVRQHRLPPAQGAAIAAPPRQRLTSPVIARRLGLPLSTVGAILRRRGRLKRLEPPLLVRATATTRWGRLASRPWIYASDRAQ
jgi:transposase-like protein